MEITHQTDRTARFAGGILIVAALIMVTGAAIGFQAPSLRDAPWTDDPQLAAATIAGNPGAYAWANGLILAAAILTALGLVPASILFPSRSRPWAWSGMAAFALAATFEAVDRTISIQVFTWAAQQDFQVTDPTIQAFIRLQGGMSDLFYSLGFLAISLFGIALLKADRWGTVGWIFAAVGVLGILLHLAGAAIPAMVFFGTAGLGAVIWMLDIDRVPSN
jgi:hypothetical protein